jgi:uncharacterized repeat protein (TIGR01451 family)
MGVSLGTAVFLFIALFAVLNTTVLAAPTAPAAATDLFFSEYIEGSSNNKALEIYNGTDATVDLSEYVVELYSNGSSTPGNTLTLSAITDTMDSGEVLVIANASAAQAILDVADITSSVTFFNGDDAIALKHNGTLIDVIGVIGSDPGSFWGTSPTTTQNNTLVRKDDVCAGQPAGFPDPSDISDEWSGYASNTFSYLGAHTANCASGFTLAKKVTPSEGVAYQSTVTYTVVLKNGTAVSDTNVVFTDSLPMSTTFGAWVDQPAGATEIGDVINWSGTVENGENITFTFTALHTGSYGETITNTAEFSGDTASGTAEAAFTVEYGPTTINNARTNLVNDPRRVTLNGIATMYTGGFFAGGGNSRFYIQDATGGIAVQAFGSNGTLPEVTLGDQVTVTGNIVVFNGEIRIVPDDNVADVTIVDGTPDQVPAPIMKSIADADTDDATLGWLISTQGEIISVQDNTYNVQMDLSDGQGDSLLIFLDKNTNVDYSGIQAGDFYSVTGIAETYYSTHQLKPRIDSDFETAQPDALIVRKHGPTAVIAGQVYTYTLVTTNYTSSTFNNLVITDTVPITNASLAWIGDGGSLVGGTTINWTTGSLAPSTAITTHFAMTATGAAGTTITNDDFAALADEWTTPATGPSVETMITGGCDTGLANHLPVYDIQGSGSDSPSEGDVVNTCGVVIGVSGSLKGFFLQDPAGDGNNLTSDGVFVYRNDTPFVQVGDYISATGLVEERYGVTQLKATFPSDVELLASDWEMPVAVSLNPPADRAAADDYMEAFEGMLTAVPDNINVIGPSNAYGEFYFVRADTGVDRLVLQDNADLDGYRIGMDDGIMMLDEYIVGDVLSGVYGPLHYSFDNWKVQQMAPLDVVTATVLPTPPQFAPAAAAEFTTGAFNVLNFDGADNSVKLDKIVDAIEAMGAPTFLSLEEITVVDTYHYFDNYTVTGVITDLITALANDGHNYDYVYSHADAGGHGVAVLYDTDRVTLDGWSTLQGCSPDGSSSTTNYDPITCPSGEYPLFSRRPVIVTGTVSYDGIDSQIVFIGNHLKSKSGDGGNERRLGQSEMVADFVNGLGDVHVIVAGDLNDFVDSPPLAELYATGGLTNTFFTLPAHERYSYIFNGMSQVLDHILVSDAANADLLEFMPLHMNADYPANWEVDEMIPFSVSDHDPVVARFSLPEAAATVSILTPTNGSIFTSTNGTAVSVPVTITTTDFVIPTDGHWHLWVDGTDMGPVLGYDTMVDLLPGAHVITVELNSPSHTPLGITDSVSVTVEVQYTSYLPIIMKP